MESAELPPAALDFWPLQWLGQNWLWLCLLLAVALAVAPPFRFRQWLLKQPADFWDWLLKHPAGQFWPVGAAILPPLIPFARDWDQMVPVGPLKSGIVSVLLLAVALLQIYGQQRNEGYRKTAEMAVEQQGISLRRLAHSVEQQGIELKQQGIDLRRLAGAISYLASQAKSENEVDVD